MVSIDRCALVLPGKQPGSPTEGLAILEMDDVLEGGGDRHDQILTEIASKITFGKIKEVGLFQEGGAVQWAAVVPRSKDGTRDVSRHGLYQDEDRTHRPR